MSFLSIQALQTGNHRNRCGQIANWIFGLMAALTFYVRAAHSDISAPLADIDARTVIAHPDAMRAIAESIGRPDAQGLIGRNRTWGGLYSVRFQYGAGRALRYGLAVRDETVARVAAAALMAGLESAEADGSFPLSLPDSIANSARPGVSDQASAAAFFLSDVCPALIIAGADERQTDYIRRAMRWLANNQDRLLYKDRKAPNRLLINALAFHACGLLIHDETFTQQAEQFVEAALGFAKTDGIFIEAGGSDTSYQAVSLVAALDLLALGYQGENAARLEARWRKGSAWLAGRIADDGRLDSSLNTRTCTRETFVGRPKEVDVREVFRALAYAEAVSGRFSDKLTTFKAWLETRPDVCDHA